MLIKLKVRLKFSWSLIYIVYFCLGLNDSELFDTSLAAKGELAHRLQCRTSSKVQTCCQGATKWPTGSGKMYTPRFLGILSNFCKISFLIRALLLWEKREKWEKRKDWWLQWPLRHCQQSTARTPTAGTPPARANTHETSLKHPLNFPLLHIF